MTHRVSRSNFPSAADPRAFQITALGTLLAVGVGALGFDQQPGSILVIFAAALATQWGLSKAFAIAPFDPLSPLITALSLSILLRAPGPQYLALAASAAIASKFLIRVDGQHFFNPANFGICLLLVSGAGWISPAQWGSQAYFAFLFACLASLVLSKAKRGDIALAFLGTFATILFARAAYLGDPWPIPMKQMQSGALLLFAFFMLSDPKTTPTDRRARVVYGMLVAMLAAYLQFERYRPDGLMIALFIASPLVPLINRIGAAELKSHYDWSRPTA